MTRIKDPGPTDRPTGASHHGTAAAVVWVGSFLSILFVGATLPVVAVTEFGMPVGTSLRYGLLGVGAGYCVWMVALFRPPFHDVDR